MNMQEIRAIAKQLEIKSSGLSKAELVKRIQLGEGNIDCYATTGASTCDQTECLWRKDCLSATRE